MQRLAVTGPAAAVADELFALAAQLEQSGSPWLRRCCRTRRTALQDPSYCCAKFA
ncbi:MAG: hypothetical protein ACRDQB_09620 [Thermocrispum sp.]